MKFRICISLVLYASAICLSNDTAFISMGGDCRYPAVASEGTNMYLAWIATEGNIVSLYFRHSSDEGLSWSDNRLISNKKSLCYPPGIAVNAGMVHLAWVDYGETIDGELYYTRSLDGGKTWEKNDILTSSANSARYPLLVCQQNHVYLVWQDVENKTYFKASHDKGLTWGPDSLLAKLGRESCYCYPPAILAQGKDVSVVWTDVREIKRGLRLSAYGIPLIKNNRDANVISAIICRKSSDAGVTWGKEQILVATAVAKETKDEIDNPAILSDGPNRFLFWIDKSVQKLGEITYARFDASSAKFPVSGTALYSGQMRSPKRPSVILDKGKAIHLAWASFFGGKTIICYGQSDLAGNALMERKNLTTDSLRLHNPVITKTSSGFMHIFWFNEPKEAWSRIFKKTSKDNGVTWEN